MIKKNKKFIKIKWIYNRINNILSQIINNNNNSNNRIFIRIKIF